jgi:sugar phosphate isomerase/epimerase
LKLGASTIPFAKEPLTSDVLAKFSDAGIESLELCDYHPNFLYDDDAFCSFLQSALRDMAFHLNSIHIHLKHRDATCDLAGLDPAHRSKALADHKQAVDLAAELGGCILVTHDIAIPEPDQPEGLERRATFVDSVAQIAAYAAPKGVRLALENIPGGYTNEPERLVTLMEDLDAPNVGVVIDTGHRNMSGGDPPTTLRAIGKHLITLHLHDNHGEEDEHLLPGRGNINWDQVSAALGDINYNGVFMYEISRPEDVSELAANAAWIQGR